MADYVYSPVGDAGTKGFRGYFKRTKGFWLSPWHDIPLFADESKKLYNINRLEIPRPKQVFKLSTIEEINPLKQVAKLNHDCPFNYGALPQTWDDPEHISRRGDNEPIDVIEIGRDLIRGSVVPVKILGILDLLDEDKTDWKLLAIAESDPLFHKFNRINDVEDHLPGLLQRVKDFLKIIHPRLNETAFDGEFKDAEYANEIIADTHQSWRTLITRNPPPNGLKTVCREPGAAFVAKNEHWHSTVMNRTHITKRGNSPDFE
uniref:inorganic diphosphatase n=1 Tax=Panagrolaimus davidi TaxID=227884 RepID=A0A914Q135_9BILA